MKKLAVLASGRGSNLQSLLDNSESGKLDAKIVLVLSDVESAQALERARKHHAEALFLDPEGKSKEDYYSAIAKEIKGRNIDLIVLAGFMRIIPPSFVRQFENRIINIHPSLLPAFQGLRPHKQALEAGAKVSGCTAHFVTPELDGGPIIVQKAVEVKENDTEETLSARILEQEHKILPKAVQLFCEGRLKINGRKVLINYKGFEDNWK